MPHLSALAKWIHRQLPHVEPIEQAKVWWRLGCSDYVPSTRALHMAIGKWFGGDNPPDEKTCVQYEERMRAAIVAAVKHDAGVR